jgi:membrane protease subunit HflK
MPWNEPGKQNKDPWGNRNDQGPPDLDEVFRRLKDRIGRMFGGRGGGGGAGLPGRFGTGGVWLILGILLIAWLLSGIYIVDEGERAVVLRFGKFQEVTLPGPHWRIPFPIETVEVVPVSQYRTVQQKAEMLTEDENIVIIELEVQYTVKDASAYLFNVRDPDTTIRQAMESAIREVVGKNKMDYILTQGREDVELKTGELLQTVLDRYGTGLLVQNVNMTEAQPPEAVQGAFSDAIKAREDEVRFINEAEAYRNEVVPRARGDAQRLIEEAEAYRTRVVKASQGEASRFLNLLAEYKKAPEVTRERLYLETIESMLGDASKIMVDVEGGNNLLYLPLDQIVRQDERQRSSEDAFEFSPSPETDSSRLGVGSDSGGRSRLRTREMQ